MNNTGWVAGNMLYRYVYIIREVYSSCRMLGSIEPTSKARHGLTR